MRDRGDASYEEASDGGWQEQWQAAVDRPRGMDTDGVVITLPWARKGEASSWMALKEGRGGAHWGSPKLCGQGHRELVGESEPMIG